MKCVFYQLFVCHKANFRPMRGGTLTHPVLITAQVLFRPEGHQEPRNKVGLQILAEKTVELELGTFQNRKKRAIPLYHSPKILLPSWNCSIAVFSFVFLFLFVDVTCYPTMIIPNPANNLFYKHDISKETLMQMWKSRNTFVFIQ